MSNKTNVERLYQLIIENDECLRVIQWDDLYVNEYDTPQSVINAFVRIFLGTNFSEFDDNIDNFVLIANQEERKEALIKFFETIVKDLKEDKE
ncbi:hypothetical protein [Anaerococcus obesiensis]|uniref:hypothetical protein n=1 Tax=Anaerococcus obesiensis TaxID=1287640 RepID=UPI003996A5DC